MSPLGLEQRALPNRSDQSSPDLACAVLIRLNDAITWIKYTLGRAAILPRVAAGCLFGRALRLVSGKVPRPGTHSSVHQQLLIQ